MKVTVNPLALIMWLWVLAVGIGGAVIAVAYAIKLAKIVLS